MSSGKLRRRLEGLLSKDARFVRGSVGGSVAWAVQGSGGSPWQGDVADCGTISDKSWDAVTITWNNGHVAIVHHGDMREILRSPIKSVVAFR